MISGRLTGVVQGKFRMRNLERSVFRSFMLSE